MRAFGEKLALLLRWSGRVEVTSKLAPSTLPLHLRRKNTFSSECLASPVPPFPLIKTSVSLFIGRLEKLERIVGIGETRVCIHSMGRTNKTSLHRPLFHSTYGERILSPPNTSQTPFRHFPYIRTLFQIKWKTHRVFHK